MKKTRLFMSNFGFSLLAYIVSIILGLVALVIRNHVTWASNFVPYAPQNVPLWVEIIMWLCVLIVIALYFFLGARLKLLGNHWLNYLSICGISVLALLLVFASLYAHWIQYLLIFVHVPFFRLGNLINIGINNIHAVTAILAVLPSAIIWFGMLYKSRAV